MRRRTVGVLFAGVALGSTGHIAAVTVTSIVALELGPRPDARRPARRGGRARRGARRDRPRRGHGQVGSSARVLPAATLVGVIGALVAVAGIVIDSFPVLLAGCVAIGFGNSSNQLSRYAVRGHVSEQPTRLGDRHSRLGVDGRRGHRPKSRRGQRRYRRFARAAAAQRAVPGADRARRHRGAAVASCFCGPDPRDLADKSADAGQGAGAAGPAWARSCAGRSVAFAVLALIAGQFVMVLIMTMTPLHMTDHGHDLSAVGIVISAHVFGMFALAPISGRLTDRFGSLPVIAAGLAMILASALLSAVAPADEQLVLLIALFLLGWGWNLGFVAGSSMLTGAVSSTERPRVQGVSDSLIWSTSAIASLGSGLVVGAWGFAMLGIGGAYRRRGRRCRPARARSCRAFVRPGRSARTDRGVRASSVATLPTKVGGTVPTQMQLWRPCTCEWQIGPRQPGSRCSGPSYFRWRSCSPARQSFVGVRLPPP